MLQFTWNDGSVHDFDTLPEASRKAILSRIVGHFNNEAASAKIGFGRMKFAEACLPPVKAISVAATVARDWLDSHPDEASAFVKDWYQAKLEAILAGTLGVRQSNGSATSVDPLDREMRRIAVEELTTALKAHGFKLPRGDETFTMGGKSFTRDELVERRLAKPDNEKEGAHGERIEAEARRVLAAKAKKDKAIAGASVAEALGL